MAKVLSSSDNAKEEKLKGIGEQYGRTVEALKCVMGEHFHTGYYEPGSTVSVSDNPAAQIRMIDEVLRFAFVSDDEESIPKSILDVGCGTGGTCRYLARKYGANCKGITISHDEVEIAQARATAQGLQEKVSFEVADALALPFPNGLFDLVWCMEIAEYIPVKEKEKLVSEMVRVAAPGATIILTSWCHRDLAPRELSLRSDEQNLLQKMCGLILLSPFCSASDFINLFESHHLKDIKTDDWSQYAIPYQRANVDSSCTIEGFFSLLWTGGWNALKFMRAANMIIKAHKKGLVKLLVLSCRKP